MAITEVEYRRYKINFLYHFTHVENVSSIRERGLLSYNAVQEAGLVVKNISDPKVQKLREDRLISDRPLARLCPPVFHQKTLCCGAARAFRTKSSSFTLTEIC